MMFAKDPTHQTWYEAKAERRASITMDAIALAGYDGNALREWAKTQGWPDDNGASLTTLEADACFAVDVPAPLFSAIAFLLNEYIVQGKRVVGPDLLRRVNEHFGPGGH